jgi:hypothetical protein
MGVSGARETIPPDASRVGEVFLAFLKLGLTSFGGPIAHLGYFRDELVLRRKWVSEEAYAELVALCQFLPGPASSQTGFVLGLLRAGPLGALAAWTAALLQTLVTAGQRHPVWGSGSIGKMLIEPSMASVMTEGPIKCFCHLP